MQRNAGRSKRLEEERSELSPLPPRRLESFTRAGVRLSKLSEKQIVAHCQLELGFVFSALSR